MEGKNWVRTRSDKIMSMREKGFPGELMALSIPLHECIDPFNKGNVSQDLSRRARLEYAYNKANDKEDRDA